MKYLVIAALCVWLFYLGILIGQIFNKFNKESDGRLVIVEDKGDYYVAITTPPEELKDKTAITLDVYITKGD